MSPLAIEMLIWFCTRAPEAGVFPNLRTHQPQKEIRNWFVTEGVIRPADAYSPEPIYEATDKGRAWLSLICGTPIPTVVERWVDPRSGSIVEPTS